MSKKKFTFDDLNRELNELHDYLKKEKYKESEIKQLLQPFAPKSVDFRGAKLACFLAIALYALSFSDRVAWNLSALGRLCMVQLLPVWDWRFLGDTTCLIKSNTVAVDQFNCGMCEYLDQPVVVPASVRPDDLVYKFLRINRPVIVQGGLENWQLDERQLFDDDDLLQSQPCDVSSNFDDSELTVEGLVKRARILDNFYVHWKNCDFEAMRATRKFTPRPSYMPTMMSPVTTNWLLWNKNYNVTKFKPISLTEIYAVVVQVEGATDLILEPRKNCHSECPTLNVTLRENQALVVTEMWDLKYRPCGTGEHLAVVIETKQSL